jgi:iron complex outermembrane recepter protein
MIRLHFRAAVCSALLTGVISTGHAQAPAPTAEVDQGLTEIVVTARRVEERAQDVPISMTVLNQQQLSNHNVVSAGDLAQVTPGLEVDSEFGTDVTVFTLRGFTQQLNTTPSVAVYFGDAVVPRGGNVSEPAGNGIAAGSLFDLQNVQVLKGPQGTLFGRNTDGGAVLVVPKKPTSDFEGYIEGAYGNYAMGEVQAVVNVPISEQVRLRLSVNHETRNGYLDNVSGVGPRDFNDIDYTAARLGLVVDIMPNLENYLIATYNLSINHGSLPQAFACNAGVPAFAVECNSTLGALQGQGKYAVINDIPGAESYSKQYQVINTTTWRINESLTVKNIANYGDLFSVLDSSLFGGYLLTGQPGGNIPYAASTSDPTSAGARTTDQYTWSDELQLSGNLLDGKLTWQGGGYIERSGPLGGPTGTRSAALLYCPSVATFTCAGLGALDNEYATINYNDQAAYGQATYAVFDQLKVTAGIRYTNDNTTSSTTSVDYAVFPPIIPGTPFVAGQPGFTFCSSSLPTVSLATGCAQRFTQNSHAPTYMADIDYTPFQNTMLYGKYSRGYRTGGVATFVADGYHLFGPEHVNTFELGEKTTFAGPIPGTFDVSAHYNAFSDQQLQAGFTGPNVPATSGIVNAGKSRIWGVEVESTLVPVKALTLGVSYAYLNTKLESAFSQLPPGGLYNQVFYPAVVGGELPFSPKNKLSANATYRLPVPENVGRLSLDTSFTYTSSLLVSATAAPYSSISAYGLLGANLHWDSIFGSAIDGELFATNLTNRLYSNDLTQLYDTVFGLAARYLGEPRMYGVRVKVRFGK